MDGRTDRQTDIARSAFDADIYFTRSEILPSSCYIYTLFNYFYSFIMGSVYEKKTDIGKKHKISYTFHFSTES